MDDLTVATVMSDALLSRGLGDAAVFNSELNVMRTERGLDPLPAQSATPAARDDASADEQLDAELFRPPADASAYKLDLPTDRQLSASDVAEVQTIRTAMQTAGFPVEIANELNRQVNAAAAADPLTDAQREQTRQSGMVALSRLHGEDVGEVLRVARAAYASLAPELRALAQRANLENSPWFVSTLANLAKAKGRMR